MHAFTGAGSPSHKWRIEMSTKPLDIEPDIEILGATNVPNSDDNSCICFEMIQGQT